MIEQGKVGILRGASFTEWARLLLQYLQSLAVVPSCEALLIEGPKRVFAVGASARWWAAGLVSYIKTTTASWLEGIRNQFIVGQTPGNVVDGLHVSSRRRNERFHVTLCCEGVKRKVCFREVRAQ